MDRQAIYDKVKHHLLVAQPRPALSGEGGYNYQNLAGDRCAIGCLIPDGHPGLNSEFRVRGLLSSYPDLGQLWGVDTADIEFLEYLQAVHDSYLPLGWEAELAYIAKKFRLNP